MDSFRKPRLDCSTWNALGMHLPGIVQSLTQIQKGAEWSLTVPGRASERFDLKGVPSIQVQPVARLRGTQEIHLVVDCPFSVLSTFSITKSEFDFYFSFVSLAYEKRSNFFQAEFFLDNTALVKEYPHFKDIVPGDELIAKLACWKMNENFSFPSFE